MAVGPYISDEEMNIDATSNERLVAISFLFILSLFRTLHSISSKPVFPPIYLSVL